MLRCPYCNTDYVDTGCVCFNPYCPSKFPMPAAAGTLIPLPAMNQTLKKDNGKLRMDLVPIEVMEEMAKVLTFGLEKGYGENSWKEVESKRYEAALLRHYLAHKKGEIVDPESNLLHLSHMLCNVAFLMYREINKERK
jgi:hypothetical protein